MTGFGRIRAVPCPQRLLAFDFPQRQRCIVALA
jgi:hypothetical protein